jgi:hypothetical protein
MTSPLPERARFDQVPMMGSSIIWKVAVDAPADKQRARHRKRDLSSEGSCSFVRGPLFREWEIETKARKYTQEGNGTLGNLTP